MAWVFLSGECFGICENEGSSGMSSGREPTPLILELGARIRKLRQKRNWTQADVEAHTGLDRGHISEMEAGKRAITIVTLQIIAKCFDTTMARLLRGL